MIDLIAMKPVFRFFKWLFIFLLLVGIFSISGFIYYLESSIDKIMSEEKQVYLIKVINESPELPDSFYQTYNKYYPNAFEQGVWGSIFQQVLGNRRNQCPCREIYIHPGYTDKKWILFAQVIVALEIEEHFSNKKCFEYNMSISGFGYNTRNIQEASEKYYGKKIEELNEREILELSIISKNPSQLNPFRGKEKLDKAVNALIKTHNEQ